VAARKTFSGGLDMTKSNGGEYRENQLPMHY